MYNINRRTSKPGRHVSSPGSTHLNVKLHLVHSSHSLGSHTRTENIYFMITWRGGWRYVMNYIQMAASERGPLRLSIGGGHLENFQNKQSQIPITPVSRPLLSLPTGTHDYPTHQRSGHSVHTMHRYSCG